MKNLILKKWMMTLMIVMCFGIGAFAQSLRIEGRVTDESGTPLPGVTVLIKGTPYGTWTDRDGKFAILISPDDTLVFSFFGFETKEIEIKKWNGENVELKEKESVEGNLFSKNKIVTEKEYLFLPRKENDVA